MNCIIQVTKCPEVNGFIDPRATFWKSTSKLCQQHVTTESPPNELVGTRGGVGVNALRRVEGQLMFPVAKDTVFST